MFFFQIFAEFDKIIIALSNLLRYLLNWNFPNRHIFGSHFLFYDVMKYILTVVKIIIYLCLFTIFVIFVYYLNLFRT